MNLLIALFTTALALTQHSAMPAGMSHDEHLKQIARDEALKKRGGDAMGFDQDSAEHHFILDASGGSIQVTTKPGADPGVVAEVRSHLRTIADDFARGDFGKPFQTHDEVPSRRNANEECGRATVSYRYEESPAEAAVRCGQRHRRLERHPRLPSLPDRRAQDRRSATTEGEVNVRCNDRRRGGN